MATSLFCQCPKCGQKVTLLNNMPDAGKVMQVGGLPGPSAKATCPECRTEFQPENVGAERTEGA
jgi:hypothetical protein